MGQTLLIGTLIGWLSFFAEGGHGDAKLLFCAYGASSNFQRADRQTDVVVAVVEIKSSTAITNAPVSDFEMISQPGQLTKMERVISVEQFNAPHAAPKNKFGYFLYDRDTRLWGGRLPAGIVRLRVRALSAEGTLRDWAGGRCRLRIGRLVIEGPVDAEWPSG